MDRYLAFPLQRKELLRAAARLVPESQLGELSRIFAIADSDHDGRVDLGELNFLVEESASGSSTFGTAYVRACGNGSATLDYLDFIIAIDGAISRDMLSLLSPAIARSSISCRFPLDVTSARQYAQSTQDT